MGKKLEKVTVTISCLLVPGGILIETGDHGLPFLQAGRPGHGNYRENRGSQGSYAGGGGRRHWMGLPILVLARTVRITVITR